MIVEVAHPSWISHLPRGARRERHALVRASTTVRLNEVRLAETQEAGTFAHSDRYGHKGPPTQLPVRSHGGRPWIPVPLSGMAPGADATDAFRAFLSGRGSTGRGGVECAYLFWRTALVPALDPHPDRVLAPGARGADPGNSGIGRVTADGRDAAAGAVRDLLDREVLMVDGTPWMRLRPVLHPAASTPLRFEAVQRRLGHMFDDMLPFDPCDLPAALSQWTVFETPATRPEAARLASLLGGRPEPTALLANLNALACHASRCLEGLARRDRAQGGEAGGGTLARLAPAAALARSGVLGGIGPDEACAAAVRLREDAAHLLGHDLPNAVLHLANAMRAYLDGHALPRARGIAASRPVDADDADAIAHLAP